MRAFFRSSSRGTRGPHAVVLGLGVNGLGVVRALAWRDIPVVGVYERVGEIGRYSRHCRAVSVPDVERDPAGFLQEVCALGRRLGDQPVLFPTTDAQVALVSRERTALGKLFRFRL